MNESYVPKALYPFCIGHPIYPHFIEVTRFPFSQFHHVEISLKLDKCPRPNLP